MQHAAVEYFTTFATYIIIIVYQQTRPARANTNCKDDVRDTWILYVDMRIDPKLLCIQIYRYRAIHQTCSPKLFPIIIS